MVRTAKKKKKAYDLNQHRVIRPVQIITLTAPIPNAVDEIFKYFYTSKKMLTFHVNHLPNKQMIHIKFQDIFSEK